MKPSISDKRSNLTDEVRKKKDENLKTIFSFCTKTKNEDNQGPKKFNTGIKRSKQETEKPVKSLRNYIKQKCKWVTFLFVIYTIVFGAVMSIPILVNHFRVISQNQAEQERSITFRAQALSPEIERVITEWSCKSIYKSMM